MMPKHGGEGHEQSPVIEREEQMQEKDLGAGLNV